MLKNPVNYLKKMGASLACLCLLASCSKVLMPKPLDNKPSIAFETMWSEIDAHYSFFDYKKIDWAAVKTKYAAQIDNSMSDDSLYNVLAAMLYELNDGHVNLYAPFNRSRNWSFKDDFPDNFNGNFVFRHYFKRDYHATGNLPNQILPDSIGYVRYASFASPISKGDLDYVMDRFSDCKGIIIDVRDNGGGSMANIFKIMGYFVSEKTLVGYINTKSGPAHNAFNKPDPLYVKPVKGRKPFLKPVIVLINRGCYSATTHFAGFMSLLPQVTLVGDQTGGGGGLPISRDLPNGWQYRFSATYQTLPDGTQIEHGVPADIAVGTGPQEELSVKDAIIEKGIELILKETAAKPKE